MLDPAEWRWLERAKAMLDNEIMKFPVQFPERFCSYNLFQSEKGIEHETLTNQQAPHVIGISHRMASYP